MIPIHNPPHPGEAIYGDALPSKGLSLTALARHLGYSRGQLPTVLYGYAAISADLAYRLTKQHLAEQAVYDLWQAQHHQHPSRDCI